MKQRSQNTGLPQEHELASTWDSFVHELKQTGYVYEDSQPSTSTAEQDTAASTSRWHKRNLGTTLKRLGTRKDSSKV